MAVVIVALQISLTRPPSSALPRTRRGIDYIPQDVGERSEVTTGHGSLRIAFAFRKVMCQLACPGTHLWGDARAVASMVLALSALFRALRGRVGGRASSQNAGSACRRCTIGPWSAVVGCSALSAEDW